MKKSPPYTNSAFRRSAWIGMHRRAPQLLSAIVLSIMSALSTGLSYAEDKPSHAAASEQRTCYVKDIKERGHHGDVKRDHLRAFHSHDIRQIALSSTEGLMYDLVGLGGSSIG